jgi:hypothetical protein
MCPKGEVQEGEVQSKGSVTWSLRDWRDPGGVGPSSALILPSKRGWLPLPSSICSTSGSSVPISLHGFSLAPLETNCYTV